jgi:hypothetical protein
MNNADEYATQKNSPRKELIAVSREAVQTAEDARAIAVKRMGEERLANERQDSADAQAKSQGQANDAIRQKEEAQSDTAKALAAKTQADADAAKRNPIWPLIRRHQRRRSARLRPMPTDPV